MANVKAIPDGYRTITPYLLVDGVGSYIEFLKNGLGAEEVDRSETPNGTVIHAAVRIGDSMVMMGQAPPDGKPTSAMLYMYVQDVDAVYEQALAAGGKSIREPRDEFYGDRTGGVADPAGNQWWVATHLEDVDREEINRRAAKARG